MQPGASLPIREFLIVGFALAALVGPATAAADPEGTAETVQPSAALQVSPISLERVIDNGSLARSGGKLLRWITGSSEGRVLERPYGVAWDGDALLVTDPGAGRVLRIGRKDKIVASPRFAFDTPIGVAVCWSGVVVTDARLGQVTLLDRKLRPARDLATGLARPTGIACVEDRIYVVETAAHRILVLDASGRSEAVRIMVQGRRGDGPAEFNFPSALTWHDGSVWVGDTLNFRVQRLDAKSTEFQHEFGQLGDAPGEMPRIKALAVDARGHVWISDAHLDQIGLYAADGTFLTELGGSGSEPGRFSFPAGIAAHEDGRVAVVDSLNQRIQIFRVELPKSRGRDG